MVKMKLKTKIGADFNFTGNGFRKSDVSFFVLFSIDLQKRTGFETFKKNPVNDLTTVSTVSVE